MAEVQVARRRAFDVWNEVPLVPQTTGMSCWAASAAMLIGWRESIPVDPEEVAGGIGRWQDFKDGLHPTDVDELARTWELVMDARVQWTPDALRDVLERFGPVWLGEASPALHSIVVAGMHGDGSADGTWVRINDPWPVGRGERYTISWRQLMENFHAATELAGVHAQVLHTVGRGRGARRVYRYEERREVRRARFPTPGRPRPEEVVMQGARNGRGPSQRRTVPRFSGAVLAHARSTVAAGEQYLDTTTASPDPLDGHGGSGDNLYLCWTDLPDDLTTIDVVLHLHGYSGQAATAALLKAKVAGSGLDLTGPRGGRDRPTLGIIPRGRKISPAELAKDPKANAKRYTFPALTGNGAAGVETLSQYALDWLAANVLGRTPGEINAARFIITAHSGGGAPLDKILAARHDHAWCDPHEVHVFDGLYGPTTGLEGWVDDRIAADRTLLAGAGSEPGERLDLMMSDGGGLRIVYGGGTEAGSKRVAKHLPPSDDELAAWYQTEKTTVEHGDIPRSFGGLLLQDVRSSLTPVSQSHGLARPLSAYGAPGTPGEGERYGAPLGLMSKYIKPAPRRSAPARVSSALPVSSVDQLMGRARAALGHQVIYKLGSGGKKAEADSPADSENACDCSGFVAWALGLSRKTDDPLYKKFNGGWINTDAIIHDAKTDGGFFRQLDAPVVGALLVYGSTYKEGKRKPGHVGIVTELDSEGNAAYIIDCGSSSYKKGGDAITEREPAMFRGSNTIVAWFEALDEGTATASGLGVLSRASDVTRIDRQPPITEDPRYAAGPPADATGRRRWYTDYRPADMAAAAADVRRVSGGGSWVERILRVITVDGRGKNFLTITGLDGVTFGITDFASDGGVYAFMQLCASSASDKLNEAFGEHVSEVTNRDWIREQNGSHRKRDADDRGLIRLGWFRDGLDRLVSDPALHGLQLAAFVQGKVRPSLEVFQEQGFTQEILLATMVGIANSYGFGGMRRHFLIPALAEVAGRGPDGELGIAEHMLKAYVQGERKAEARAPALEVIGRGFGRVAGGIPADAPAGLGHRGTRAYLLLKYFPAGTTFSGLGTFSLTDVERFAPEPTTAASGGAVTYAADAGDAVEEETDERQELDPELMDLAELVVASDATFIPCFTAFDIAPVRQVYQDNATAASADSGDRCSCIVMLDVALGALLPLERQERKARGSSTRKVQSAKLTTDTIEKAMKQLQDRGFAAAPVKLDFVDRRGKRAGTLKPEHLKTSVQDEVLRLSPDAGCWYAYGLSIMDGYHSVLLLVDHTGTDATIYWLDQFATGIDDDVTTTLDDRITTKTQAWWQAVMDSKGVGYNTTVRVWQLKKPAGP